MDLIRELGVLAFASRLKRISEMLMRDVSRIYDDLDVDFQARWFPVLYLLGRQSPMAVTEIANALRMTHPAINQIASGMSGAGILSGARDKKDERRRMLSLTARGKEVMTALSPVWEDIAAATENVLDTTGIDILKALDRIEEALNQEDMYSRVSLRIKERQYRAVEIIDYAPRFKKYFESLNREWLEKHFTVEGKDHELLTDPFGTIIKPGGHIFFARIDKCIVGTVALIRIDDDTLELAKMAVTENARRHQAGKRLVVSVIDKARELKAKRLMLHTSKKLEAANALYKKLGFTVLKNAPQPIGFIRPTITMILEL